MTSNSMDDRDESARDAEWTHAVDAYWEVPAPSPEAIDRTAALAAVAVANQGGRQGKSFRKSFRWTVGLAAVLSLVLLGWWLVFGARQPTSPDLRLPPAPSQVAERGVVVPPRDTIPASAARPSRNPVPGSSTPTVDRVVAPVPAHHDTNTSMVPPGPRPVPLGPAEMAGLGETARARLRAGLGDEGLQQLMKLLREAGQDGLPRESLRDRAFAGLAHGASSAEILGAVERRAVTLRQARAALGPATKVEELVAGADALEAGASASELAQIAQHFPENRITAGLLTLVGLTAAGVPAPDGVAALVQGVNAGAADATLLGWRASIAADVARGVPPLVALRVQVARLSLLPRP